MSLKKETLDIDGFEEVIKFSDDETGLLSIIAIHSTRLGPSIGGTRIQPYASFQDGLEDVLRLSEGMSFKTSFLDGRSGGAKSVIFYDPNKGIPDALLASFAEAINTFEGRYYCAEDVGCFQDQLKVIQRYTPFIVGVDVEGSSGNPSAYTALSTMMAIDAGLDFLYGSKTLRGKKVAIQGVGQVGKILAEMLFYKGCDLVVCDINEAATEHLRHKFNAKVVGIDEIYDVDAEIFAPCALGACLNKDTIKRLKCRLVAGSANNQLLSDEDSLRLKERGILYAPDFVANCGGLINVQTELMPQGYCPKIARDEVFKTYDKMLYIFEIAKRENSDPHSVAIKMAEERVLELEKKGAPEFVVHHSQVELV